MQEGERVAALEVHVGIIRTDVGEIKKDIKSLLEFKWRIYGSTAAIAFVVGGAAELVMRYLERATP